MAEVHTAEQLPDSGPAAEHTGRRKYKPDWYFSADQNLQLGRPMGKVHLLNLQKAKSSCDSNTLLGKY